MSNTENEKDFAPNGSLPANPGDKERDEQLRKIAKKRAAFKTVLLMYVLVNLFLVILWWFTSGSGSYFWPMWPMLGWGLSLAFQYKDAYLNNGWLSEEREFEKLKKNK